MPPYFSAAPTRRRLAWIGVGIAALLIASTSLFALSRKEADDSHTAEEPVYELAAVDVLVLKPQPLARSLRLSGALHPVRHAIAKAHTGGTVVEIRVQEGDRIRRGDLLARIDPRELQADRDGRLAALRKAQAELVLATKNRDNSVVLLRERLISQNAFDQTVAAYEAAVANEQAAAAHLRLAEIALHDSAIRADFDGIVAERRVEVGERVMPDAPLVTVVDLSHMQWEALIPVTDIPAVRAGQSATFHVDGFGAREFHGRVERISPQATAGTRSLIVYLSVANADGALKGGMFADGTLLLQTTAPQLAVPSAAIRTDEQGPFVLGLQNGIVARLSVQPGADFPDEGMTVVDGVAEATQIIVAPTALKAGTRAKVSIS